jgi:hypothetical protein
MQSNSSSSYLPLAARILPFAAAVYFFSFVSADPDLWGHIKFGWETWENRAVSPVDPYSFTAYGQDWINHEWFAEVLFYLTYRFLGDGGLLFGKLIIGLWMVALLGKICTFRHNVPLVTAGVLTLGIIVISPAFMVRPQVFSLLFFTLFVFLIYLYLEKGKDRLFLLPILMVLWVNLHGGFLIGWLILLVVAGWTTIPCFSPSSDGGHKATRFWLWVALASLATFVNPYGYRLHLFLFNTLSLPRQISEWAPINLFDLSFLRFKVLALLFVVTVLLRRPKWKESWQVVIGAATLVAAVLHRRHTPFFAIVACPYLCFGLSALVERIGFGHRKLQLTPLSGNLLAIFVVFLAAYQLYGGFRTYTAARCRIIVDPKDYPVGATQFISLNDIRGNLLLPFDWGEYAIWHLYPACRVSIDGRFRTVYPESVIQDHFLADDDRQGWMQLLEKYPADILLVEQIPFFQDMIHEKSPWVYVYSDPTSILFLKNNDKNEAVLKRFEAGKRQYGTKLDFYFP